MLAEEAAAGEPAGDAQSTSPCLCLKPVAFLSWTCGRVGMIQWWQGLWPSCAKIALDGNEVDDDVSLCVGPLSASPPLM